MAPLGNIVRSLLGLQVIATCVSASAIPFQEGLKRAPVEAADLEKRHYEKIKPKVFVLNAVRLSALPHHPED